MIEKINIHNYKSFQSLEDFELKPVNILIGANNSGKSNFLDVFAFIRDTLLDNHSQNHQGNGTAGWQGALQKRGGLESVCFEKETSFNIRFFTQNLRYYLRIDKSPSTLYDQIGDEQLTNLIDSAKKYFELRNNNVAIYDENGSNLSTSTIHQRTALGEFLKQMELFIRENRGDMQAFDFVKNLSEIKIYGRIHTEPGSPIRTPKVSKGETIFDEGGGNLAGVLHQLSQAYPKFYSQLNSLLKILFRDFSRISFPSNEKGELLIHWEDATGRIMNASQLSDGTLKFLCLIAILKNPAPPALIGLDEPDAKLHPRMTSLLPEIIEEASRRTQIIATTHSPDFVSSFAPEEIIILQQYKGATEMRRFSTKGALEMWLEDFDTRKLWLMGELESRW